jgi:hypothetical protein
MAGFAICDREYEDNLIQSFRGGVVARYDPFMIHGFTYN